MKGLNGPIKRSKVLTHLKLQKPDVVFLQETHLRLKDQCRLQTRWTSHIFHSNFDSRSRGVAILINKTVHFSIDNVISDMNGRYVIVKGKIPQTPVVLANVYAPNFDNAHFAQDLLSKLPALNTHLLIFGGDLNCVIDPDLDKSSIVMKAPSAMSKIVSEFMVQNGYIDPWRHLNPTVRKYSFYSCVHQSFSRIDYFFINNSLIPLVVNSEYLPIVISDHAPLSLDILLFPFHTFRSPWRFNSLLLSDLAFCEYISNSIDDFLLTNQTDSISYSLLWETLKAFLRGQIISYSAYVNKERRNRIKKLSDSIQALDDQYAHRPTPELHKQRLNLQAEFNLLTTGEAERLLLRTRCNYYEYGDKVGRLLAHQLRNRAASRFVTQIAQPDGVLSSDPVEINSTFKNFFSFLYKTEASGHSEEMNQFLGRINFPRVDPLLVPELDGPITLEEITKSINSLQSKKSPGPDGLPSEFYKKFHVKLAPLLLSVFEESLDLGMLPLTLRQASITLLPKDGKDPTLCNSYRPISLLNVDVKILAKILAFPLEVVLPSIISEEQTGFIKGRYSFSNIRTLFNILYSRQNSVSSEVVISLDAEKAFDRIEWVYLFRVLKEFGFGEGLISWIRLLYVDPQASVSTNSVNSEYFTLSRGTRQGCPLSPLLFAIAIEPLSIMLRTLPVFQGIIRKGIEHKLALYADDLLLYVTDPIASIPEIIHLLDDFGKFSGYKLNLQKSECLPINQSGQKLKQNDLPFHLESSKFKYLGVNVTLSLP